MTGSSLSEHVNLIFYQVMLLLLLVGIRGMNRQRKQGRLEKFCGTEFGSSEK